MSSRVKLTANEKNLIRRYLIWCYKTTKEDLDRIDRYFTQEKVDGFLLRDLKAGKAYRQSSEDDDYRKLVDQFKIYMEAKKAKVLEKKFVAPQGAERPDYRYLRDRFTAIEKAIHHFLGPKELEKINHLYEQEMTLRILHAREHS